jgi:pimeloyl-ACP methyl ester carboxylesterase
MNRTTRTVAGGIGLLLGAGGLSLWRWKRGRLDELAAGSELVETRRGVVEVARRGAGDPVLVLHGDPGGYDQALRLGEAVFPEGFEIIAPSRPGYLRTPLGDNRSPSEQAALLVALLDELGVERALVVGLSGGGPSALHLAAGYPERVSGVILGSAVTTAFDERMFDTGNPLVDPLLTSAPVLDVRSGLMAVLRRVNPDGFVRGMHAGLSTLEGEELAAYVDSVTADPEQRSRALGVVSTVLPASARVEGTLNDERWFRELPLVEYGSIRCPVLVVHGEFDGVVPMAHAEFVAGAVRDARLLRLKADHLIWLGPDADRAGEEVRAFAASVVEAASSSEDEPFVD